MVEECFGYEISEDVLCDVIVLKNCECCVLVNFYYFGQLNFLVFSGSDILKVVYGVIFWFDKEVLINELDVMIVCVCQQWEEGQ